MMADVAELRIDLAKEFSAFPAGRDEKDGAYSGERFREEFLAPKLKDAIAENGKLIINLEGVKSFGSSFLEEAFGGLVRKRKFTKKQLERHLGFEFEWSGYRRYERAINRYISEA